MKSNPTQPSTVVTIAGQEFRLAFDLQAIAEAEEVSGLPLITGITAKVAQTPKLSLVRAMFYASLLRHHPTVTSAGASASVTVHNWVEVWTKVLEAWSKFLAEPNEEISPLAGQS